MHTASEEVLLRQQKYDFIVCLNVITPLTYGKYLRSCRTVS